LWVGLKDEYFLACVPDGIVKKDGKNVGIIEIKCPFTKRLNTIDEISNINTSFLSKSEGKIVLRQNHNYYY
jgi:phage FluMu protein Com